MGLEIRLMGQPEITLDRERRSVRGRKAWAVLTYVLLSDRPPSRQQLASLLFGEAANPLAALRWSLAELRRAMGPRASIGGDPLHLDLDPGTSVDLLDLLAGRWPDQVTVSSELLEGAYFDTSPAFEAWLLVARRQLANRLEAALTRRAQYCLANQDFEALIDWAARLVELNPLDERHHALLVRALADSGDPVSAQRHLRAASSLLSRELGIEPSPELLQAAATPTATNQTWSGPGTVQAMIDAGRAASAAGANEAALHCFTAAINGAETSADQLLLTKALIAYGAALQRLGTSMADAEPALRRGLNLAQQHADQTSTIIAHRELGFLYIQAGYHHDGDNHLLTAADLAHGDDNQLASIRAIQAMSWSDQALYQPAFDAAAEAVTRADRCGRGRKRAWALAMLGRLHLVHHNITAAADTLDESLRIARADRWSAFVAWPEILAAEVDLQRGHLDDAGRRLDHAHALAQHYHDPGLLALVTRGHALIAAHTNSPTAIGLIEQARRHALRGSRTYVWIQAQVAATRCDLLLTTNAADPAPAIDEWIELASRAGLRHSIIHAHLAASRMGRPGAYTTATTLAAQLNLPLDPDHQQ